LDKIARIRSEPSENLSISRELFAIVFAIGLHSRLFDEVRPCRMELGPFAAHCPFVMPARIPDVDRKTRTRRGCLLYRQLEMNG
jgi:hypothetical protein